MKVVSFNSEDQILIVSCDYWEIESMGYDVKKQQDMTGYFYETVLSHLNVFVKCELPEKVPPKRKCVNNNFEKSRFSA